MARIRSIKPEIVGSEQLGRASIPARLLFTWLIPCADDGGRFRAAPELLRGLIFPYDNDVTNDDVATWLGQLTAAGLVRVYEVEGQTYGELTGWERHQRIDNARRLVFPPPTSTNGSATHGDIGPVDPGAEPGDLGSPPNNSEEFGEIPLDLDQDQDQEGEGDLDQEGNTHSRARTRSGAPSRTRAPASGRGRRVCPHPEAFQQLWDGWPAAKQTRFEEARAAWAELVVDVDPATVLAAAVTWQRYWAAEGIAPRYIPRVGNWLRSGDWKLTPASGGTDEQARLERKRSIIDDFVNGRDPP
jgi:hypothetical protein